MDTKKEGRKETYFRELDWEIKIKFFSHIFPFSSRPGNYPPVCFIEMLKSLINPSTHDSGDRAGLKETKQTELNLFQFTES